MKMQKSLIGKAVKKAIVVGCLVAVTTTGALAAVEVDPKIAPYQKVSGVSGNLDSIGSDTLNNLMAYWAEGFRKEYPNVRIQIEGKGSTTAPPALVAGTAQLGPMSRPMKKDEEDAFVSKYGYKVTSIGVALDSLAVFVNKDNPIKSLSLPQVDAIFSKTHKGGIAEDYKTWGQLGLTGEWANLPLSLFGRNSASGTYGFFKEHALAKGDYKDTVKEQPGSASVVMGITEDKNGIGYSGIGYKTSGVKAVALSNKKGEKSHEASFENVMNGSYPLSRTLYIYVAKEPNKPMPAQTAEFLKYILSKAGQEIVVKDGFLPLPAKVVEKELAKLK